MKTKNIPLYNAIKSAGGNKEVAKKIGCTDRSLRYVTNGDFSTFKLALKLSVVTGVHVCDLCPEFYPPEIFGEIPIEKITSFKLEEAENEEKNEPY